MIVKSGFDCFNTAVFGENKLMDLTASSDNLKSQIESYKFKLLNRSSMEMDNSEEVKYQSQHLETEDLNDDDEQPKLSSAPSDSDITDSADEGSQDSTDSKNNVNSLFHKHGPMFVKTLVFSYAYYELSKKLLNFLAKRVFKIEDIEFKWNLYGYLQS